MHTHEDVKTGLSIAKWGSNHTLTQNTDLKDDQPQQQQDPYDQSNQVGCTPQAQANTCA
jgi:hypothetical protein